MTVLFFYLYYLYCLSIFQRTCCFRFKSGCKGKGFIFNYQTFSEVFFHFFFLLISQALYAKGKECIKEKTKAVFFANRTAKIKRIINKLQIFFEKYFYLSLFLCVTFHTSVSVFQSYHFPSLGKRVQRYSI